MPPIQAGGRTSETCGSRRSPLRHIQQECASSAMGRNRVEPNGAPAESAMAPEPEVNSGHWRPRHGIRVDLTARDVIQAPKTGASNHAQRLVLFVAANRDDRNHALRYTTYNSETAVLTIEQLTLQAVVHVAVAGLVKNSGNSFISLFLRQATNPVTALLCRAIS